MHPLCICTAWAQKAQRLTSKRFYGLEYLAYLIISGRRAKKSHVKIQYCAFQKLKYRGKTWTTWWPPYKLNSFDISNNLKVQFSIGMVSLMFSGVPPISWLECSCFEMFIFGRKLISGWICVDKEEGEMFKAAANENLSWTPRGGRGRGRGMCAGLILLNTISPHGLLVEKRFQKKSMQQWRKLYDMGMLKPNEWKSENRNTDNLGKKLLDFRGV